MQLKMIEIDRIEIPEVRVTSSFSDEVMEQFRLSVTTVGVIQPIHVLDDDGKYILVDGLHRLQEAMARGDKKIQAVVQPGSMKDVLIQNLVTSGLKGKPKSSELRKVIGVLQSEYQMDSIAIRKMTGLSQPYIENLQWVNRAIPAVQQCLDEEVISLGHAVLLARIEKQDVQERVLGACLQNYMTVSTLKHHIDLVNQILDNPPAAPTVEETIVERKVRCSGCRDEYPPEDVVSYMLCPHCSSEIYARTRQKSTP